MVEVSYVWQVDEQWRHFPHTLEELILYIKLTFICFKFLHTYYKIVLLELIMWLTFVHTHGFDWNFSHVKEILTICQDEHIEEMSLECNNFVREIYIKWWLSLTQPCKFVPNVETWHTINLIDHLFKGTSFINSNLKG